MTIDQRLSQIRTEWTVLRLAHEGGPSDAQAAVQLLITRYRPAVLSYLRRLLGDAHAAEDLAQEFSLTLLRGGLKGADPARGRFRHYVKGVLFHLVSKYRSRAARLPAALDAEHPLWKDLSSGQLDAAGAAQGAFAQAWREQLIARTMEGLRQANRTYYELLRHQAEHPDASAEEVGRALAEVLRKEMSPDAVRQTRKRARQKFADLLFDTVAQSLVTDDVAEVESELADLGLLSYCQPGDG